MPSVRTIKPTIQLFGRIWHGCVKCGKPTFRIVLQYDAGTVEPAVDEVLTGATSLATGIVEKVVLESGTWAGGDAAGRIYMTSGTKVDVNFAWGTEDEAVTGSAGAAMVHNKAWQILDGRMHPLDNLVFRDGKYYCRAHYDMVFGDEGLDEAGRSFDKSENYRNEEPY